MNQKNIKKRHQQFNAISFQNNQLTLQHFNTAPIPPEALEKLEKISPGFANRFVMMAETEQSHRHKIDIEIIEERKKDSRCEYYEAMLGQFFGWSIGIIAIIVSAYMSTNGAQFAGGTIGTTALLTLVGTFVYGRKHTPITHKNNSKLPTNNTTAPSSTP